MTLPDKPSTDATDVRQKAEALERASLKPEDGVAYRDIDGQVIRMVGTEVDITERKLAEEHLWATDQKLRLLVHNLNSGVVVHAPDTQILFVNEQASKLLGLSIDQMMGKTAIDASWRFVREDKTLMPLEEYPVQRVIATLQPLRDLVLGIDRPLTEDRVWVIVDASPDLDVDGRLRQVIVTFIDITEKKQFENILTFLAHSSSNPASDDFFHILARYISETLDMGFVCIDRLDGDNLTAHTVAVYSNGTFEDNVSYALKDTPCGEVVGKHVCCFPTSIKKLFPNDEVLQQMEAESCIGVTLWSHDGRPIGLIAVIGAKPIAHRALAESLLKMVAVRAAGELERKQAEQALRESEETHRALIEGLPDIIMRFDRDGRHLFVSGNVRQVVDIEANQFIGKTHAELGFPEAQCRLWEESIRRVFDSGAPFETEFTVEGKLRAATFNWRLIPEWDTAGKVTSVLSISRDISAHRKAEQDYKTLFREMLDGFALHEIQCDEQGNPVDYRFLAVNPAFERMTGLKAEAIVGRTVLEVLPGTEKPWIETYGKVALSGEPIFFENHSAELGKHFAVTAYRPFPGQFACIFQDITDIKKAQAEKEKIEIQLAQSQKMESVGRLAGGVAHDFNNMLAVILGNVEMLLDQTSQEQPIHFDLNEIKKAARRSADLTRQLLAFARKQTVAPKVINVNELVTGMTNMLKRLIGENIDMVWIPGEQLWPTKIDPSQLDQIMANLCVNARDAIVDVGKITIETSNCMFDEEACKDLPGFVPGEFVLLAVSDNGCGMSKETLSHIFEPFFTTKSMGQGTGLGLATVYGAVKQNNGFIDVNSEPGQGTSFKIYLPRHRTKMDLLPEKESDAAGKRGHETILLVEDEPLLLKLTTKMLQREGYTVVVAETPSEAIRLVNEHDGRIDLLMTDVVMPEMNGRDLAKNILALYPHLKCLFTSGYTANVIAHHGVLDPGVHFIQKPFSMQELVVKVRHVLGNE